MRLLAASAAVAVALTASAGLAQTNHADMDHSAHRGAGPRPAAASALSEPGQGAFAALSEVVRLLETRPDTDWSKVDLRALRDHLIDMDRLVRDTIVTEEALPNGIEAVVRGDGATLAAAQRMVPAHAAMLRRSGMRAEARVHDDRVVLRVTADDPATAKRIQGLGFYGLMASQDHHREHHMAIVKGDGH